MVKRTKALRLSFLRRNLDQEVDGSNPAYSLFPNFEEQLEIKYIADIVRKKKVCQSVVYGQKTNRLKSGPKLKKTVKS